MFGINAKLPPFQGYYGDDSYIGLCPMLLLKPFQGKQTKMHCGYFLTRKKILWESNLAQKTKNT